MLKGWLHYSVLIRQHWQEEDTLANITGSNPPVPEALMAVSREASVQRQKTWDNLIRNPKDRFSGELKGEWCRTRTIKKKKKDMQHLGLTELRNQFKNLEELYTYWVEFEDIASRATPDKMSCKWSCHCPVTPDPETTPEAAWLISVGAAQWPQILFSDKSKVCKIFSSMKFPQPDSYSGILFGGLIQSPLRLRRQVPL